MTKHESPADAVMPPSGAPLLSLADVVRKVQLHRVTLTRHIERGDLKAYHIGGVYRLREEDVNEWLAHSRVPTKEDEAHE